MIDNSQGYDGDDVRSSLLLHGILQVIPPRANRKEPIACDKAYNDRNRIERMFNRLKQFRRIATQYDKTDLSFTGFLCCAAAKLWLSSPCQQVLRFTLGRLMFTYCTIRLRSSVLSFIDRRNRLMTNSVTLRGLNPLGVLQSPRLRLRRFVAN
jgi:hypothetical protein